MNIENFINGLDYAITLCDTNGIVLYMNEKAKKTFAQEGGDLTGRNLLDCHPEPARNKLKHMMETQEKNVYTIEKKGIKKMIYQAPFYEDGIYKGFYEISLEIPFEMKNFVRTNSQ